MRQGEIQILEIRQYSSGLTLGSASILNQNPFFEMASRQFFEKSGEENDTVDPAP